MNALLSHLIDQFAGVKVLVVGEAMLDSYLAGSAGSICREAPVPIVVVAERKDVPGGAANAAANVRSLGGEPLLLSVIGDDSEGDLLWRALEDRGVATDHLFIQNSRRTLAKQRVLAEAQLLVRFDQGSVGPIDAEVETGLIDRLRRLYFDCDAVLVSDYGYGVLTPRIIRAIAGLQAQLPRTLVMDSKNPAAYRRLRPTAVKPNYAEALRLLGERPAGDPRARVDQMVSHGERLLSLTGARSVVVTLDFDGAVLFERGAPAYRTYARPTVHSRAAGAGDTFVSAFTLALAAGGPSTAAAELASAASAIVVGKDGTATCSAQELRHHLSAEGKIVLALPRLVERVESYRAQGRRIVLTNGCFDILHSGHIAFLDRARGLGDVLIVGVNTDEGVRRLKGPARPINRLEDRLQVLAALSGVDHVTAFAEDTPINLIRAVRPDVFVKGGDYTRETLPEAPFVEELGGVVQILPYIEDRSTTGIIERIRSKPEAQAGRG